MMDTEEIVQYDIKYCLNLIVIGTDEEVFEGWSKLRKLEESDTFRGVNCENVLRDIFSEQISNVQEVPRIMALFSKHVTKKHFEVDPITNALAGFLMNTDLENMSQFVTILQVLSEHRVYLPEHADHTKLCEAIVTCLSSFSMSCNPKQISEFNDNADKVQNFLDSIRSISRHNEDNSEDDDDLMFACLETLYKIISDWKREQEPGPGLAAVLQLVDPSVIPRAVQWIIKESRCDRQLTQALQVLCSWLPKWRGDRLAVWVMEFVQGLEKRHKYSILLQVIEATIASIIQSLWIPGIRQNAAPVVFHILKRQSSPTLIQNIVKKVNIAIPYLTKENSESSRECVQNLVDIMNALMLRCPGHKIYVSLLNNFPVSPRFHAVQEIYNGPVWVNETMEQESVLEPPKNNIGKVGLSNLGNTCYMNSVLQALAMTRQFCHEVLNCKFSDETADRIILKKLQNLFALLLYSKRISLAPTEILLASRPSYFLPGQQQDSSEFLCHLLDVLHEQEKSNNTGADPVTTQKSKTEKRANDSIISEETGGIIKRWTTEEDLTESVALQRKTQSLADFTQGEDLEGTRQLSDSHSNSTDSGIQSVGGEETMSQSSSLVHRVLGGEIRVTYQCARCDTSSHNTDKFRDLQLCFPEEIQENQEVSVQDLINYYLTPEKLTGENKYRCDKCMKLCDAQRFMKILQAPAHLVLTLKHFHYDFESRLRTKLRHKVVYNETIQLPVWTLPSTVTETYQLYAAVVHSGYSMDYGHYFTYACDSKLDWYKFNDSYVSQTTLEDFKNLKPPDTPYILFYEKISLSDEIYEEDKPELSSLSRHLQELVANDTAAYTEELRHQTEKSQRTARCTTMFFKRNDNNSDDENPPPSNCRGAVDIPANQFLY